MSMEGFSAAQIQHHAAITLDLFVRGKIKDIGIQKKPLVKRMEAKKKSFNGAKENISMPVRFQRGANGVNDTLRGFSHDQQVGFYNPANALRANYVWREHHIGITLSETELKTQGILVGDEFEKKVRRGDDRGLTILSGVMETAISDFMEQRDVSLNALLWGDGTADASALHGIRAFIRDVPTIGTVGGLSSATHARWRNRSRTSAFFAHASYDDAWGGNRITSNPANGGALLSALDYEMVQLRRFGGMPNQALAGSAFIEAMKTELRANGQYYQGAGEMKDGMDASIPKVRFAGIEFEYDPTLDDMGRSKFAYVWDDRHIVLKPLEGDWNRMREPARPFNQFVLHKSLVCTGQLCSDQRDSALVIEIA